MPSDNKKGWRAHTLYLLAKIVLSTCHGAGSRQLNNMNFDVCIIDEVSLRMDLPRLIRDSRLTGMLLTGNSSDGSGRAVVRFCRISC